MTPEERDLLTQSIKLAEENNKMLRSMRRNARLGSFLRLLYWAIIIGTAFGFYYYTKPFIDPIIEGYAGMKENIERISNTTSKLPTWLGGND
jgi:hypothetical protein